jgi:hypothetical protein
MKVEDEGQGKNVDKLLYSAIVSLVPLMKIEVWPHSSPVIKILLCLYYASNSKLRE